MCFAAFVLSYWLLLAVKNLADEIALGVNMNFFASTDLNYLVADGLISQACYCASYDTNKSAYHPKNVRSHTCRGLAFSPINRLIALVL